ncbi:hypothetical protein CEUSTIGMA_g678.t1 [Chlamydomonas eustigma]|uniref:Glycosyltransferase n=1 Tax=Chlamydomonas eustigma TaxID=1157962 RepID=A0A250WQV5_9CHLO|nr:hypothetical protein CEUSTIGMA_g678.t1 [Chlamydomonas eustigma]|eukprot:GAX73225.1 hypothetical protein CEUSTIGMA_g678.t1 [Chlamydomonas eustigma]
MKDPSKALGDSKLLQEVLRNASNLYIMTWIPQNDLLAHPMVRAMITHGGVNTFYEAAYHGVPTVTFPLMAETGVADQLDNAMRAEELGMGITIRHDQRFDQAVVYNAVVKVIDDPKYAEAARDISRVLKGSTRHPATVAAEYIEQAVMRLRPQASLASHHKRHHPQQQHLSMPPLQVPHLIDSCGSATSNLTSSSPATQSDSTINFFWKRALWSKVDNSSLLTEGSIVYDREGRHNASQAQQKGRVVGATNYAPCCMPPLQQIVLPTSVLDTRLKFIQRLLCSISCLHHTFINYTVTPLSLNLVKAIALKPGGTHLRDALFSVCDALQNQSNLTKLILINLSFMVAAFTLRWIILRLIRWTYSLVPTILTFLYIPGAQQYTSSDMQEGMRSMRSRNMEHIHTYPSTPLQSQGREGNMAPGASDALLAPYAAAVHAAVLQQGTRQHSIFSYDFQQQRQMNSNPAADGGLSAQLPRDCDIADIMTCGHAEQDADFLATTPVVQRGSVTPSSSWGKRWATAVAGRVLGKQSHGSSDQKQSQGEEEDWAGEPGENQNDLEEVSSGHHRPACTADDCKASAISGKLDFSGISGDHATVGMPHEDYGSQINARS